MIFKDYSDNFKYYLLLIGMCIFCKPGEEGEIIGTIRSDDRGGPENFEVLPI